MLPLNLPGSTSDTSQRDVDLWKMQSGVDFGLHEAEDGSMLIGGITVHYGQASAYVQSPDGRGDIDTTGYGVGATLTWYGASGLYVDAQAQYSWYESDLNSRTARRTMIEDNNGEGYSFSLETGKRFERGNGLTLTPQAQLIYSSVSFDRFRDALGAPVSLDDGESLRGRLGLSLDKEATWVAANGTNSRSHSYGIVNLYNEFLDGTQVDLAGVKFTNRDDRVWGGVGVAGSYNWNNDKFSVYGEASVNTSLENVSDNYGINANAGFRVSW